MFAHVQEQMKEMYRAEVPQGDTWYVDANATQATKDGKKWETAFATMAAAFAVIGPGDKIYLRGNITEHLTTPLGTPHVTIIGAGNSPQHADTHPLYVLKATNSWRSTGATPLLKIRTPGWRLENILFVANAAAYAIQLDRTALEDATEEDASHLTVVGCRFAGGAGGINDTDGCYNVKIIDNVFQDQTAYCMLGVGNIGAGQGGWYVVGNRFRGFTNGVKCAFFDSVIKGNFFTDGGTPNTTVVLNTVNGISGNNFVVDNFFQTATANFNTPDVEGNATDVWWNVSIDAAAAGVDSGHEVGQPA